MINKGLHITAIVLFLLLLLSPGMRSGAGEFFKWVDEKGTVHFTDDLSRVPSKFRKQSETRSYKQDAGPAAGDAVQEELKSETPEASSKQELERFEIPYKAYEGSARRIIIPVTFNETVTAPMLLDTGAPGILITPELADRLGLFEKDDGKLLFQAGGIGGTVPAILTIIESVSAGGARADFLPTTVTEISSNAFDGLVGMDFMANYSIKIDTRKNVLTFEELPAKPDMPAGRGKTWWQSNFNTFSKIRASWKGYLDSLEHVSVNTSEAEELRRIAGEQYSEADKLYRRLDRYASRNSVPRHWRK